MASPRQLGILAAATAALAVVAVWVTQQPRESASVDGPLLPGFAARAGTAARVVLHTPGGVVTLRRDGDRYQVAERDGYPARAEEVRRLLLGLAGLRRLEAKTRRPENYVRLGLADPGSGEGEATRITVFDASDGVLADVFLGQRRAGRADPLQSEYYVRVPGDPQVWLVEGRLPDRDRAIDWLESTLLRLDLARVQQVRVRHADGETVVIRRATPEEADYRLEGVKADASVESPHLVNNVATTLASLGFEDVRRGEPPATGAAFEAQLQTFDGLSVQLTAYAEAGRTWAALAATAPAEASGGRDVAAEAAELNDRWRGWLYAIAAYQVDAVRKRRADLLAGKAGS